MRIKSSALRVVARVIGLPYAAMMSYVGLARVF